MLAIVVMPPAMAASEPVQKSSTQTGSSGNASASVGVTRWTCASMPPGITSSPPRVEFGGPAHGAAELGDAAAGDPDVGHFLATGGDDGAAADYEIKTLISHLSIVARPGGRLPPASVRAGQLESCTVRSISRF